METILCCDDQTFLYFQYSYVVYISGAGSSPQLGGHNNFSGHIYIEKDLISMNDSKNWGGTCPPCPLVPSPMYIATLFVHIADIWGLNF